MRGLLYVASALAVMALAFWAYQENYRTQASIRANSEVSRDIGRLRETLSILKAEWAYLNRPSRLADLAEMNFDKLGLLPVEKTQFARPDQLPYPPAGLARVGATVDLVGVVPQFAPDGEDWP
ncbi:cell division protein FtsL [Tropicimonas sp. IMCC34011]|uniref:cell division protein FtsL n=1 Tax=Tropicimonas sp. IMCC34011 TaxID=2248759 RepID=UPI000E24B8BF|nr:cell division protein FtsL [Tropicimonas sp. IMCC34011]